MERPLFLHSSALSEQEYQAYTCILRDILPAAADLETADVPVGEAKGWIRGKYGVDATLLDQILRLFPVASVQGGSFSAQQFLAVLRLISHAQAGQEVDRSLVFLQATNPLGLDQNGPPAKSPTPSAVSPTPHLPPRSSPYPAPPIRQSAPESGPGGRRTSSEDSPSTASMTFSSNPFRRSLSTHRPSPYVANSSAVTSDDDDGRHSPAYSAPIVSPTPKLSRAPSTPSVAPLTKPKKTPTVLEEPFSRNPFFAKPDAPTLPVATPPHLPPRKPSSSVLPPPRHPAPPPPPPKPTVTRKPSHGHTASTSALIRQSLMAAKTAQKASESTLQQMKTWEVIKSSVPGNSLKERAKAEKPSDVHITSTAVAKSIASPPSSVSSSSLEYVAGARVPPPPPPRSTTSSRGPSPSKQPRPEPAPRLSIDDVDDVVQFNRATSPDIGRPVRSKSLHGTNSSSPRPPVPTPPPRRRRPESVSVSTNSAPTPVLPGSATSSSSASASASAVSPSPFSLSRRSSVQHHINSPSTPHSQANSASAGQDPFSTFVSTMKNLPKATENLFSPTTSELQKIGGKVEGGLAPGRGYISHRGAEGQRLMREDDDDDEEEKSYRRLSDAPTVDSDTPGMDPGTDGPEEPWGMFEGRPPPPARGGSSSTVTSVNLSQRQAVQAELDQLRSGGWTRRRITVGYGPRKASLVVSEVLRSSKATCFLFPKTLNNLKIVFLVRTYSAAVGIHRQPDDLLDSTLRQLWRFRTRLGTPNLRYALDPGRPRSLA